MWTINFIQSALAAENNDYRKILGEVAIACKNNGFFRDPKWHDVLISTFKCVHNAAENLKISNISVAESKNFLMSEPGIEISDDDCQTSDASECVEDFLMSEHEIQISDDDCQTSDTSECVEDEDVRTEEVHCDDKTKSDGDAQLLTKVSNDENTKIRNSFEDGRYDTIVIEDDPTENIVNDQILSGKDDHINIGDENKNGIDEQTKNENDDVPEIRNDNNVPSQTEIEDETQNGDDNRTGHGDNIIKENKCGDSDQTMIFVKSKSLKRNRTNWSLDSEDFDENLFTSTPVKSTQKKHKPNENIIDSDCKAWTSYQFIEDLKGAKWLELCDEVNEKQSNVKFLSHFDQYKELHMVLEKDIFLKSAEHKINIANAQKSCTVSYINTNIQIKNLIAAAPKALKSAKMHKKERKLEL